MIKVVIETDHPTALNVISAANPNAKAGNTSGDINNESKARAKRLFDPTIASEAKTPKTTESKVVAKPTLILFIAAKCR
jgi:hypothetical protein